MEDVCVCRNIEKAYGQPVLKGCSLHIPAGSIYGLIGENGAGKTTLIRILTGLQKPDAGTYSLFDVDASDKAIHLARKRMGAIVEMPALDPELDALSNVRAQARLLELEPGHEKEALEWVGLNDPGTKKAGDFSLGMRQRLGLAMALIGHPDFILLDEPTNGLDPQGMIELRELILKLNKEHRITFLISSHVLAELAKLADWYGFLKARRNLTNTQNQSWKSRRSRWKNSFPIGIETGWRTRRWAPTAGGGKPIVRPESSPWNWRKPASTCARSRSSTRTWKPCTCKS